MYQMTTITDYIVHAIISLNKKKRRERRFVYIFSMSDTITNYYCIVTTIHCCTYSLFLLPLVNMGLVARTNAVERVFVLNEKAHWSNFLAREHRVLIIVLTERIVIDIHRLYVRISMSVNDIHEKGFTQSTTTTTTTTIVYLVLNFNRLRSSARDHFYLLTD
jgi:hypothetical protein